MHNVIKTKLLATAAFFFTAIAASASSITMDVNTLDTNQRAGKLFFSEDGGVTEVAGWAGVIKVKFDGQPVSGYYDTLCVDLFHNISLNTSYTVTPGALDTIANGGRVAWLYTNWVALGSMQNMAQALGGGATTNEVGMALQLAVWDIVHDNADGLAAGAIRSTAHTNTRVISAFNQFQQLSAGQTSSGAAIYTDVIGGVTTQRQISVAFAAPTETPEPGTIGLAGLALAAVAIARKRNS
jgi:hypothetical protein